VSSPSPWNSGLTERPGQQATDARHAVYLCHPRTFELEALGPTVWPGLALMKPERAG